VSSRNPLDILKEIGSESIAEKTHIVKQYIDAILDKSFDKINKVQFGGFVSILEREYQLDLTSLREEYRAFDTSETKHNGPHPKEEDIFVSGASTNRKKRFVAISMVVLLLAIIAIVVFISNELRSNGHIEINNTEIDKAKETLESVSSVNLEPGSESYEVGSVQDKKLMDQESNETQTDAVVHEDIVLIPRVKIWLGIIDMKTFKRRVEMTAEPIRIDASKEWLIVTGHGRLRVEQGEKEFIYNERDKMLFMVENGIFQQIDKKEFRARNRGRIW